MAHALTKLYEPIKEGAMGEWKPPQEYHIALEAQASPLKPGNDYNSKKKRTIQ